MKQTYDIKELIKDITSLLPDLVYSIYDFDVIFLKDEEGLLSNLYEIVNKTQKVYKIDALGLNILAKSLSNVLFFGISGYETFQNFDKYSDLIGNELVKNAYFFLDITDCEVFEINCRDKKIDKILKDKYLGNIIEGATS